MDADVVHVHFLHIPGFVGGWSIPFYPHFVLQVADERNMKLLLTALARRINEDKPKLVLRIADSTLKKVIGRGIKGSKVAVLGLTFRGDVADTRNSPSYELIDMLRRKGASEIRTHDPYVTTDADLTERGALLDSDVLEATKGSDLIIIMTDHSSFKKTPTPRDLLRNASAQAILMDGRNLLPTEPGAFGGEKSILERREGFNVFMKLG